MRKSLETLTAETQSQSSTHLELAVQIRTELEAQTSAFYEKQALHKVTYQTPVEKHFKAKQAKESYVTKAREKYEGDLLRIKSYTSQMQQSDVNEKDLEKIRLKLARAQQTVQANEKDFSSFTRDLAEILPQWEDHWKDFCDKCQDLEEERLEFMRENLWAYANAVSTICVNIDLVCAFTLALSCRASSN